MAIDLYNPIEETNMSIVFEKVKLFLSLGSEKWGQNNTIIILTLEDDFSLIKSLAEKDKLDYEKSIYLIFQMLSGNEIYILCEKVLFCFD